MITPKELENVKLQTLAKQNKTRVAVGLGTCGLAAGAEALYEKMQQELKALNIEGIEVTRTGCLGLCKFEPMLEVLVPGEPTVIYVQLTVGKVARIVREHLAEGRVVSEYTLAEADGNGPGLHSQVRLALRNCGVIDPESIEEYIAHDGYHGLARALAALTPDEVIQAVKDSGLRGRGGGGFSTGAKWQFTRQAAGAHKYVVCNADEGDPGAFMDRSILEGDPHAVIEAMTIAGYAVGAQEGYIYVRAEYPLAVERLNKAISQAKELGVLGENILGSNFSFDLKLKLGSGAFVCGEETALIASIEGQRGMPRPRPPFPAVKGLWQKPTLINNVETFANIPQIVLKGPGWFASLGTEKSKGTKVFALGGKITNTGLVEIPMGTTLREIIYEMGGGIPGGKAFKAAQTGGPSGGCIPASLIDTPIDYDSLIAIGSMMGSGGLIVMDEDTCMVDVARFFLEFTVDESCGKCTPCRVGTRRMLQILERITRGEGEDGDIEQLEALAAGMKAGSLCGLGQTASNPVLSTLRYFRHEYEAHIKDKRCPAGVCQNLLRYTIDPEVCRGCALCKKVCPVSAITGKIKQKHEIDPETCIKCGACASKCPFHAISRR